MSFFQKYGKPQKIRATKGDSLTDLLSQSIAKQKRLLSGERIVGQKGKEIKSWFDKGLFNPKVGVYGLFGDSKYVCDKGREGEMLADFEGAFKSGEFDSYIKQLELKRLKKA